MAEQRRKGGLGRGLGALIPSGPGPDAGDAPRPRLGDGAASVIYGESSPSSSGEGKPSPGAVKGAPTFLQNANREVGSAVSHVAEAQPVQPAPVGASYEEIPVGAIAPNEKNPRTVFDEDELAELVHSIKEFGLLQPIVVRRSQTTPGEYELIMGERRWRAGAKAGLKKIPAIVRDVDDDAMLRDALLENIHRVQLNPLEEAAAYQQLLEEFNVTQAELAEKIGRSRPVITNTIRLLQLPVPVQQRVAAGVLSAGHARALLGVKTDNADEVQQAIADRIVAEGLSVRATEEAVTLANRDGVAPEPKPKREPIPQPEYLTQSAERLSDRFDTRVQVTMGKRKGKMVIEFGDREDFERIMELIDSSRS